MQIYAATTAEIYFSLQRGSSTKEGKWALLRASTCPRMMHRYFPEELTENRAKKSDSLLTEAAKMKS